MRIGEAGVRRCRGGRGLGPGTGGPRINSAEGAPVGAGRNRSGSEVRPAGRPSDRGRGAGWWGGRVVGGGGGGQAVVRQVVLSLQVVLDGFLIPFIRRPSPE